MEERTCFLAGATEFLDSLGQCRIAGARFVQVGAALTGGQSPDCAKDSHFAIDGVTHGKVILYPSMRKATPKGARNLLKTARDIQPAHNPFPATGFVTRSVPFRFLLVAPAGKFCPPAPHERPKR